jgi:hypothetical protein
LARLKLFEQLQKSQKPYTLNTFMSTSVDEKKAFKKSHVIKISSYQAGHPGVHLNPFDMAAHKNEDEVLFPPGSQFRIKSIKGKKILMEALASKGSPEPTTTGTKQPPMPKVTNGGTLITHELLHPENGTNLTVLDTSPDGSCGIHAMLGSEGGEGVVAHANPQLLRDSLAARIADGDVDVGRYSRMIQELIREICQRIINGKKLSAVEELLISQFHQVKDFTLLYGELLEGHDQRLVVVRNEREMSSQSIVALVKSDDASPGIVAVRTQLIDQIMASTSAGDQEARILLETAAAEKKIAVLQGVTDVYLAGVIHEINDIITTALQGSDHSLGDRLHAAYQCSSDLDDKLRDETTNFFNDHMIKLYLAYSEVVKNPYYYLREEDLREIAEIQQRNLIIYREDDVGQFVEHVNHASADATGGHTMHVFHSGAHYEQAKLEIIE